EQRTENPRVGGSIPSLGTTKYKASSLIQNDDNTTSVNQSSTKKLNPKKYRKFWVDLAVNDYDKFEIYASKNNVSVYKATRLIVTAFINGKLIPKPPIDSSTQS
ncbi:MAG: hypothetical protein IBX55_17465, partial [Methyloprofundus sp.]|nr:hypothetical protein [Methyloprofundus sp.]